MNEVGHGVPNGVYNVECVGAAAVFVGVPVGYDFPDIFDGFVFSEGYAIEEQDFAVEIFADVVAVV